MTTKEDIDTQLDLLEQRLQQLVAQVPREEVLDAFALDAQVLTQAPPVEYIAYIVGRIERMLAEAGVVPLERGKD